MQYRIADDYECKRVAVVGAGPSGVDIAVDVARKATEVLYKLCFLAKQKL